jgi:hypothetical protein
MLTKMRTANATIADQQASVADPDVEPDAEKARAKAIVAVKDREPGMVAEKDREPAVVAEKDREPAVVAANHAARQPLNPKNKYT